MRECLSITLLVAIVSCSCATLGLARPSNGDRDAAAALRAALEYVPGADKDTLVAGPKLTATARRGLALVRPFIESRDVPGAPLDGIKGLPDGYLLVQSLTVRGDTAWFEAWQGPVPREISNPACGTGYQIQLTRADTSWARVSLKKTVC